MAFDSEAENTLFLKYLLKPSWHLLLYWKEICIWFLRIKDFVTVHEESQLLLAFDSEAENTLFLKYLLKTLLTTITVLEGNMYLVYPD